MLKFENILVPKPIREVNASDWLGHRNVLEEMCEGFSDWFLNKSIFESSFILSEFFCRSKCCFFNCVENPPLYLIIDQSLFKTRFFKVTMRFLSFTLKKDLSGICKRTKM